MSYRHLIFDLDGTLTNPYTGILNSLQYALEQLNFRNIPTDVPIEFIGPPLQKSFSELFGLNKKQTDLAVEYFRVYYGRSGLYENEVFSGIHELLENLHNTGYKLYVATSKLEKYARIILEHFELDKYIDDLVGADYGGNHSKSALIQKILISYKISQTDCVMIGDTKFDLIGAAECNIDSIAVGYGFGEKDKLLKYNPNLYFETVEDLSDFLVGIH